MAAVKTEPPLVVIVGPTASGKTSLAVSLAERFGGEIICADSRTIYRGMDIGTAKPSPEDRAKVPHWGLDLVNPGERFTAADFKMYAGEKIAEIRARRRVPFLTGGTGLYIDGVLFDYDFGEQYDVGLRRTLEEKSLKELYIYCEQHNIELPENDKNKRYIIRAIEQKGVNQRRRKLPADNNFIVGIATHPHTLRIRIGDRTEQLFQNGVVEEATVLGKKYGWDNEAMTGNVYPLIRRYLEDELTLKEVKDKFTTLDWQLARRQLTWLRRNPHILWLLSTEVKEYLTGVLANEH